MASQYRCIYRDPYEHFSQSNASLHECDPSCLTKKLFMDTSCLT